MLVEFKKVKQIPGEGFRRWFSDTLFELIVWFEEDREEIFGFQLCYNREQQGKALTWKKSNGYLFNIVDEGEGTFLTPKRTPVLQQCRCFDNEDMAEMFEKSSRQIDSSVAAFVMQKLLEYGSHNRAQ